MGSVIKIVSEAIEQMPPQEREVILVWAQKAKEITEQENLTKKEKLKQLGQIETGSAVLAFLKTLVVALKKYSWDIRSWPARGALLGLAGGVAAFGGQAAGIAAFGGAIGINLFLLTSAGGALLGTVVSELRDAAKKPKNGG